jgi:hypothetical protein
MPVLRHSPTTLKRLLCLVLLIALLVSPALVSAQVQQGATVTVLRGEIAVIRPDGSAVQPAPSGTTVGPGDEIRTIARASALITFFSGTEIELGAETILVVEQLSRDGNKVDISLKQVLGSTVNRVQTLAGTGSSYQIQAGGAVALVRGTTFALVGPVTTSAGDVVSLACTDDCTSASTFAGCPMGPYSGLGVTTSGGQIASDCVSFGVGRTEGLYEAASQGVTTTEQKVQGDTRGVPAGQVAAGQRQESAARAEQVANERDRDPARTTGPGTPTPSIVASPDASVTSTPTTTTTPATPSATPAASPTATAPVVATATAVVSATATATGTPAQACSTQTRSGGAGTTTTQHQLGRTSGTFRYEYQAYSVPDRFQIVYQGTTLLDTGSVSNAGAVNVAFSGTSTVVTVTVIGPSGTSWDYIVNCPT